MYMHFIYKIIYIYGIEYIKSAIVELIKYIGRSIHNILNIIPNSIK